MTETEALMLELLKEANAEIKKLHERLDSLEAKIGTEPVEGSLPETYDVDFVAEYLRIPRNTVLKRIREGELKATRTGKRYVITDADLKEFLNKDEEENLLGKYVLFEERRNAKEAVLSRGWVEEIDSDKNTVRVVCDDEYEGVRFYDARTEDIIEILPYKNPPVRVE